MTTPLDQLWHDHASWSQATFGTDAERSPVGALRHLEKEAKEAIEAYELYVSTAPTTGKEIYATEIADCFLLVLDAARRGGLTLDQLVTAATNKLAINKTRTYPRTPDGIPSEHVRNAPTCAHGIAVDASCEGCRRYILPLSSRGTIATSPGGGS